MRKTAYILFAALTAASCNYLDIDPVGQVIPHKTSEFRALLTEGYAQFPFRNSKSLTCMFSDEIGLFYENAIYSGSDAVALAYNYRWEYGRQMYELPYGDYYRAIFQTIAVIDDVMHAEKDSDEPREQILGEAYALRAYAHFDLVNLYGQPYDAATARTDRGVPLYTQIDIEQRFRPASVAAVYKQILADIAAAEESMSVERQSSPTLNYRFSQDALQAFKARVMLYMGNWQEAYDAATPLLAKYELTDLNTLEEKTPLPWTGTSPEAILALDRPFYGAAGDLLGGSVISEHILALFDPDNDLRRNYFTEVTSSETDELLGYRPDRGTSDRSSLRVAEMYLIAAEAAAHLPGKLADAREHLLTLQAKRFRPEAAEALRSRAEAMDAEALLREIADERARELLLEGHRWMDLRRTTRPRITKTYKGEQYTLQAGDSRYTLPFPQSAVDNNPDLKD